MGEEKVRNTELERLFPILQHFPFFPPQAHAHTQNVALRGPQCLTESFPHSKSVNGTTFSERAPMLLWHFI